MGRRELLLVEVDVGEYEHEHEHVNEHEYGYDHVYVNVNVYVSCRRHLEPRRKRDGRNTRRCPARLSFRGPSAGSVPYELVSSSGPFAVRARIYLNSSYCSPPRL